MSCWNSSTSPSSPSGCASRWTRRRRRCSIISRAAAAGSAASRMGEKGLLWYDETGAVRTLPALPIPRERVIDTNGAGDVFHGAYVYSYLEQSRQKLARPFRIRARRIDLQDPAPRQRGRIADACRHRSGQAGVPGRRMTGCSLGIAWGAFSSPAASTWMWWRPPTGIQKSAKPSPAKPCCIFPAARAPTRRWRRPSSARRPR